jgi:hypothetical protein
MMERASDEKRPGQAIEHGHLSVRDYKNLKQKFDTKWLHSFKASCVLSTDGAVQTLSITVAGKYSFFECNYGEEPMSRLNQLLWALEIKAN